MKTYNTVKKAWADMIEDCKNAKDTIHFEQFLLSDFHKDEIGAEIAELFIYKAKEGVAVKLHLDIFASRKIFETPYLQKLKDAGVSIKFTSFKIKYFLPPHILKTRRNHRKLLIIDNEIIYVGGVVFYEPVRDWYDFQIRLTGDMASAFIKIYNLSSNNSDSDAKFDPKISENFLVDVNDFKHRYINHILQDKFGKANTQITIITPYLSIPPRFFKSLIEAQKRGVRIKVLVPLVPDNPFAVFSNQYMAYKLKKHGINVLASTGPMNHAKVIFVDDWVTFGSCNFDYLSLQYNKELNLSTSDLHLFNQVKDCTELYFKETIHFYDEYINHQSFSKKYSILISGFLFKWLA